VYKIIFTLAYLAGHGELTVTTVTPLYAPEFGTSGICKAWAKRHGHKIANDLYRHGAKKVTSACIRSDELEIVQTTAKGQDV